MRIQMMAAIVIMLGLVLSGCASSGSAGAADGAELHDGQANYVFVLITTGPKAAEKSADERKSIFEGHMSNMQRLADEGKLIVAGPFGGARNKNWRGLFIMDTPKVDEAKAWADSDPGVQSGVFSLEFRPMRASIELRKTMQFEKELKAAQASSPPPAPGTAGGPPRNVRGYVMVTGADAARAERTIARSPMAEKVVWSGRFTDFAGGAVYVMDAKDAKEVEAALGGEGEIARGKMGLDSWWSTVSLERLSR
jgi:uncharacterized protein YciI